MPPVSRLLRVLTFTSLLTAFCGVSPAQLINVSTRAKVLAGDEVMIAGFIIGGTTSKTVVVNVAGPSLTNFGVTNALANPTLTLVRSSDNSVIGTNDDWKTQSKPTDVAAIIATGFQPNNDLEPAVIATLPPGAYTVIVQGVNGSSGVGLVGAFAVAEQPSLLDGGSAILEDSNGTMIGPLVGEFAVVITANGTRVPLRISRFTQSPFGATWDNETPQFLWSDSGCTGDRFFTSGQAVLGARAMGAVVNENGGWNLYLAVGQPSIRTYVAFSNPGGLPSNCVNLGRVEQAMLFSVSKTPISLPYQPPFFIH
jgi:hypothetical protein